MDFGKIRMYLLNFAVSVIYSIFHGIGFVFVEENCRI